MPKPQITSKDGYLPENRMESESTVEACSAYRGEAERRDGVHHLIGKVVSRSNLNRAYERVRANKGSPGIDGMTVNGLYAYLVLNREELIQQIKDGSYEPQPVRRVEIPKPDGFKRKLGVPTVLDRFVQQAMLQVMEKIIDPTFSENSFGFRPGRSAHDAMDRAKEYYDQG